MPSSATRRSCWARTLARPSTRTTPCSASTIRRSTNRTRATLVVRSTLCSPARARRLRVDTRRTCSGTRTATRDATRTSRCCSSRTTTSTIRSLSLTSGARCRRRRSGPLARNLRFVSCRRLSSTWRTMRCVTTLRMRCLLKVREREQQEICCNIIYILNCCRLLSLLHRTSEFCWCALQSNVGYIRFFRFDIELGWVHYYYLFIYLFIHYYYYSSLLLTTNNIRQVCAACSRRC